MSRRRWLSTCRGPCADSAHGLPNDGGPWRFSVAHDEADQKRRAGVRPRDVDGSWPRGGDARHARLRRVGGGRELPHLARGVHDLFRRLGHLLLRLPPPTRELARFIDDVGHPLSAPCPLGRAGHCAGDRRALDDRGRRRDSVARRKRAANRVPHGQLGLDIRRRVDGDLRLLLGLAAHVGRRMAAAVQLAAVRAGRGNWNRGIPACLGARLESGQVLQASRSVFFRVGKRRYSVAGTSTASGQESGRTSSSPEYTVGGG